MGGRGVRDRSSPENRRHGRTVRSSVLYSLFHAPPRGNIHLILLVYSSVLQHRPHSQPAKGTRLSALGLLLLLGVEDCADALPDDLRGLCSIDGCPDTLLAVVVRDSGGLRVVGRQTLLESLGVVIGSLDKRLASDIILHVLLGRARWPERVEGRPVSMQGCIVHRSTPHSAGSHVTIYSQDSVRLARDVKISANFNSAHSKAHNPPELLVVAASAGGVDETTSDTADEEVVVDLEFNSMVEVLLLGRKHAIQLLSLSGRAGESVQDEAVVEGSERRTREVRSGRIERRTGAMRRKQDIAFRTQWCESPHFVSAGFR